MDELQEYEDVKFDTPTVGNTNTVKVTWFLMGAAVVGLGWLGSSLYNKRQARKSEETPSDEA